MSSTNPSIKHNLFANYVAQIYSMGIGIIMAPVYLTYMGTEAYGLIGFFTMMAAWFALLDLGLTPTLVRETARFRGGAIGVDTLRAFVRALELIFGAISLAGAIAMVLFAHTIATHWLKVRELPIEQVTTAVMLMGLAVPLRWISGLYRAVITGFERQVWLGGYNVTVSTVRYIGVLIVFVTLGTSPVHFFTYQLIVAVAEMGGMLFMTYRLIHRRSGPREKFSWKPLFGTLTFSLTIAFASTVWVVISQTDKLVLSKLLTLGEYGVFSLAVVAAGAISSLAGPFSQALLPRITKLVAERNDIGVARLYSSATQSVCVLVTPALVALTFYAEQVLRAWTGNPQIAHHAAPILCLYAIGNSWVVLASFPFFLLYAKGDLRLHFIGCAAQIVLLVPLFLWGARHYGAFGTGMVWAVVLSLYGLTWPALVHARMYKGLHWKWMMGDVLPIVVPTLLVGWLLALLVPWPAGRWPTLAVVAVLGLVLLAVAGAGSSLIRNEVRTRSAPWITRILKARA